MEGARHLHHARSRLRAGVKSPGVTLDCCVWRNRGFDMNARVAARPEAWKHTLMRSASLSVFGYGHASRHLPSLTTRADYSRALTHVRALFAGKRELRV